MRSDQDKVKPQRRGRGARVFLPAGFGLCVALLVSGCSRSHVQETVTVAPRATPVPAPREIDTSRSSFLPAVDRETEAAGDALAHAMVALKKKHRDEALYFMNLARTRLTGLTRRLNHSVTDTSANSDPTHERLISDLRALDAAERSALHNDYQQSATQLHSLSDELDRLNSKLIDRQN